MIFVIIAVVFVIVFEKIKRIWYVTLQFKSEK